MTPSLAKGRTINTYLSVVHVYALPTIVELRGGTGLFKGWNCATAYAMRPAIVTDVLSISEPNRKCHAGNLLCMQKPHVWILLVPADSSHLDLCFGKFTNSNIAFTVL